MGQLLGQGQRLLVPLHSLGRIAQTPQRLGRIDQAPYPWYHLMAEDQRPLGHRVGKGKSLLGVGPGCRIVPQVVQRRPEQA